MREEMQILPENLRGGMTRYLQHGIEPGSFLRAVLENDLLNAFGRADNENKRNLEEIVRWIYNYAPADSWGSTAKVEAWMNKHSEV